MKFKELIVNKLHIISAVLIVIQPLMDIFSYFVSEMGMSNFITLAIRLLVLFVSLILGFAVSNKKYIYFVLGGILAAIYACHLYAVIDAGILNFVSDVSNYIRVVQTPVLVLVFISFMKADKKVYEGLESGMAVAFIIMLCVQVISTLTGTDPHTYTSDGTGIRGWFSNTSSQSANLSTLAPIFLIWQMNFKKKRPVIFVISAILSCLSLYYYSTRLTYLGIMALTVGLGVMILVLRRREWKKSVLLLALAAVFAVLLPTSPMQVHLDNQAQSVLDFQELVDKELGEDKDKVDDLLNKDPDSAINGEDEKDEKPLTQDEKEKLISELTPVYEKYVPDFVSIFGARRTIEMYDYASSVIEFPFARAKKIMFAEAVMNELPLSAKLFGIELDRFIVEINDNGEMKTVNYDVENDFHGIYYLYGGVGFVFYIAFLLYFAVIIIIALIKNFKKYFTLEAVAYGIALVCSVIHIYNTAGVLRRPNASVYLSAILAIIYYFVFLRDYGEKEELEEIKE